MLPRNFPERVNRRRKSALERLPTGHEFERGQLMARIVPDARSVRTKKFRGVARGHRKQEA